MVPHAKCDRTRLIQLRASQPSLPNPLTRNTFAGSPPAATATPAGTSTAAAVDDGATPGPGRPPWLHLPAFFKRGYATSQLLRTDPRSNLTRPSPECLTRRPGPGQRRRELRLTAPPCRARASASDVRVALVPSQKLPPIENFRHGPLLRACFPATQRERERATTRWLARSTVASHPSFLPRPRPAGRGAGTPRFPAVIRPLTLPTNPFINQASH
jgi:hypothetical protein